MSQKVSPLLFNTYIYKKSKWFTSRNLKFSLNEDLQLRELVSLICKYKIVNQYFFIDKIVYYKYTTKIKVYIYFYCNFVYFKQNLLLNKRKKLTYLNTFFLYYKYFEMLQIKKLEIIKLLRILINSKLAILVYLKNINPNYNSIKNISTYNFKSKQNLATKYNFINQQFINSNKTKLYLFQSMQKFNKQNTILNTPVLNNNLGKHINKRYNELKYFKTLRFLLYTICYPNQSILTTSVASLINLIFFELHYLDNTLKNYNFFFYTLFNVIREQLKIYLKDDNCALKGIRIQIKGRYFLTKRKKIFIFKLGSLNLNQIDLTKDYYNLNLTKSTGSSSIKIWLTYKKNI